MQVFFPFSRSARSARILGCAPIWSLLLLAIALVFAPALDARPSAAHAQASKGGATAHVRISGPLDKGTHSLLRRGIQAAKAGSGTLVVELDTPGGEMELMFLLATQLADANKDGVTTVAWIHDRAYSAGALVALACERIYMRSQGVIGAALLVQPTPDGGLRTIEDPAVAEKFNSAMRSAFRAFAESHQRPPALAEAMVDLEVGVRQVRLASGEVRIVTAGEYDDMRATQGGVQLVRTIAERGTLIALSGSEAVAFGLADGIADSLEDVLGMVGVSGAQLNSLERTRSEDFASWLSAVHYILIGVGVTALVAEFKTPGFGLAGAVAIACFGLALFGNYLVGLADVPHLLAVGIGLVLVAVELFVMPGAVYPGAIGAALIFGGLAFAQAGPSLWASPFGRELAIDSALKLMVGIAVALLAGGFLSRLLPKTPLIGRLLQGPTPAFAGGAPAKEYVRAPRVGELAQALTPLRPVGKVRIDGQPDEVEARSAGAVIDAGARVRVVEVEGLRAVVDVATEQNS